MNIDEQTLTEISEEKLVGMAEKLLSEKDNIESAISVIRTELLERLKAQKIDGKRVGKYALAIQKRTTFSDVPLSFAKEVGAVTEAVDTSKLRELFAKGVKVPSAKTTEFLSMREINET